MKFKISICITENNYGIRKNQLCDMINQVHSTDYTYSQISFNINNTNIFGIIANDYFKKYQFNLDSLKQELLPVAQNIISKYPDTPDSKMPDNTPIKVSMIHIISEPLLFNPEPADVSDVDYTEEGDMPF